MNENEKIKELMSMEVLEHILGKERIEVLAEQAMKEHLDWFLRRSSNALENLLYKAAKNSTFAYIAEECGDEMHKHCAKAIENTLNKEGGIAFYMFSDNPKGQEILNEEIDKARPYIQESLHKSVDRYALRLGRDEIEEMIWEHIVNKLFNEKAEGDESMDHEEAER